MLSGLSVLHIQKAHGLGGSERHIVDLCAELARLGGRARVLWLESPGHPLDRLAAFTAEQGVDGARLAIRSHIDPGLPRRLARALDLERPDLVHLHLIHATLHGVWAARAFPGLPLVASRHGFEPYRRLPGFRALQRRVDRRCAAVLVPSEWLARAAERWEGTPRARIRVIPHGLRSEWFAPVAPERRAQVRASWGAGPEDFVVGAVARLHPSKDHGTLLRAFAGLRRRRPEARLVLVGDGPRRGRLEALAARLFASASPGAVRFVGERAADAALYAALDAAVLSTRREGFGLAALEAMAAGRPVVATRVGALPEIVRHGETGFLVAPRAAGELADALERLAADPALREALGRRSRDAAGERTAERMARAVAAEYLRALGRAGAPR